MQNTATTFDELKKYARAFTSGNVDLLILVGNPGLSKSHLLQKASRKCAHIIQGQTSAFYLYRELFAHRDQPFIIDDVDDLYNDKAAVRLLKAVCQTDAVKTVSWNTAAHQLVKENIPREFTTKSRVAIIANDWAELNRNVGAVQDRGVVVNFCPSATEVHHWVRTWHRRKRIDPDIMSYFERHLLLIVRPTVRDYIVAQQLKRSGIDWRMRLQQTWHADPDKQLVAQLLGTPSLTVPERIKQFMGQTGRSRATYYRLVKELAPSRRRLPKTEFGVTGRRQRDLPHNGNVVVRRSRA